MFKKIVFTLLLTIMGSQAPLKATNISTHNFQQDLQEFISKDFSVQDLEILETVIEESPEIQELFRGRLKANLDLEDIKYFLSLGLTFFLTLTCFTCILNLGNNNRRVPKSPTKNDPANPPY